MTKTPVESIRYGSAAFHGDGEFVIPAAEDHSFVLRLITGLVCSILWKMSRRIFVVICLAGSLLLASCSGGHRAVMPDGSPPEVHTLPASSIFTDRAVLHGTASPHESSAKVWFEFGTDPDMSGWTATPFREMRSSAASRSFRASVSGLKPYTRYYYRAAAGNEHGTRRGDIRYFPTGDCYVAVGDSITGGFNGGYGPLLADLLTNSKGYPHTVKNLGVSGATSANGPRVVSFALSEFPFAKYYLIQYGTNDASLSIRMPSGKGLRPGDPGYAFSYKDNLQRVVTMLLASGKIPCLAKVPHAANPAVDDSRIREYNAVIDELVAANGIAVIPPDFFTHFRKHPGELADGVHPNMAGYKSMANLWHAALSR